MEIKLEELKTILCGGEKPNAPKSQSELAPNSETFIVVLDRGFVYVGKTRVDGDFVEITNARCIRTWGTSKGLGELRDGPKESTKLDDAGAVIAPMRAVIHFIKCTRDW